MSSNLENCGVANSANDAVDSELGATVGLGVVATGFDGTGDGDGDDIRNPQRNFLEKITEPLLFKQS